MFLLCSRQSLCFPCTLYIIFCLITFHVIAWLLSFIAVISTMSMLSYYDLISICFYLLFDHDCVTHVTSKIICLLSLTYSGRVGVKLWDVDTLQTYL